MESLFNDIINQWVAEYEAINDVTVKIKPRKKASNEYALRHYYLCHHNTRVLVPVRIHSGNCY